MCLQIIAHSEAGAIRFFVKGRVDARCIFASLTARLRTRSDRFIGLQVVQQSLCGFRGEIFLLILKKRMRKDLIRMVPSLVPPPAYIIVIIDGHDRSIHTSTRTFHFHQGKLAILRRFSRLDVKFLG